LINQGFEELNKMFISIFALFIFNMFPSDPKGSLDASYKLFIQYLNQERLI